MDIDNNLTLFSATHYKLSDNETNSSTDIEVLQRLTPEPAETFKACPITFYGNRGKEEYHGTGKTVEEALLNCINKISGVKQELIYSTPGDKRSYPSEQ